MVREETPVSSPREPACGRCGIALERGFVLDTTYGGFTNAKWVEGAPRKGFWMMGFLLLSGRRRIPVVAYRCPQCGWLDLYAHEARR